MIDCVIKDENGRNCFMIVCVEYPAGELRQFMKRKRKRYSIYKYNKDGADEYICSAIRKDGRVVIEY